MKMQLKSMLVLFGVLFILFTGCQKSDGLVSSSTPSIAANAAPSTAENAEAAVRDLLSSDKGTSIYITTTTLTSAGAPPHVLKTGTFVASHELGDTGTYIMNIRYFDAALDSIRCTTTFIPRKTKNTGDEWTTISECSITTFLGKWHVLFGSGVYANLRGNGTVTMIPGHEMATGKISN